jgi:hypothetical protein
MGLLKWNQRKVRQMSPGELWMFIIGRGLVALGLGILLAEYFPLAGRYLAVPFIVVGLVVLLVGARVFFRQAK